MEGEETRRTTEPRNYMAPFGKGGRTERRKDQQEVVNTTLIREA